MLHKTEPKIFETVDAARVAIQRVRGRAGDKMRAEIKTRVDYEPKEQLPLGCETSFIPFVMEGNIRTLILSDLHIPYHSNNAIELAVNEGRKRKCDTVIINGDLIDCYELSRFEKDPRARTFKDECEDVMDFFAWLRSRLPDARIVYKLGNHDERYEHYVWRNAPALCGLPSITLPALLQVADFGIEMVEQKRVIVSGGLSIVHGHEFARSTFGEPVNPARGLFLRAKATTIAGHWHQPSSHTEPTLQGRPITCWSTGCLCELHPPYMPINKWRHGFAIQERFKDSFRVENLTLVDGNVV